jgi:hypothetical protein
MTDTKIKVYFWWWMKLLAALIRCAWVLARLPADAPLARGALHALILIEWPPHAHRWPHQTSVMLTDWVSALRSMRAGRTQWACPCGPASPLVGRVDPAAQLLCHQASAAVGPGQVGRVCSTTGPPGQFQPTREGWSFNPFSFFRIDSNFGNLYLFEY